jgi:Ribosomal protein L7/L12 C-terminal domain
MSDKAYAVLVTSVDPEWKIRAIKRIREITGVGLAEAAAKVENLPSTIVNGLFDSQAQELSQLLKTAGMETEIRADPANAPALKSLRQMTFDSSDTDMLSGREIVIPIAGGGQLSIAARRPLIFPDGIRLAKMEEMPRPVAHREAAWARIQSANIQTGFTLVKADDPHFAFYAEANVDAPEIWNVFSDLCRALLGPEATLLMSQLDDEPIPVGSAHTLEILQMLEPHKYQLAHDGFIQFGLIHHTGDLLTEVFVVPTKHFQVWFSDENDFRSVLQNHAIPEAAKLEFIDEYPRTMSPLSGEGVFQDREKFIEDLRKQLNRPRGRYH